MSVWARARRLVPAAERAIQLDPLDHALVSSRVGEALQRCADLALAGEDAADASRWAEGERVRARAARLWRVAPEEIVLVPGARTAVERIVRALDWRRGDRLVSAGTPSAHPPVAERHLRSLGVRQQWLPEPDPALIERALGDRRVRLVSVASADVETGAAAALAQIGSLCRERGVRLCVDGAAHSGRLPLDPRTLGIDLLVSDARGGLLSIDGAAIAYASPGIFRNPAELEPELPASPALFALGAAIDLLLELGPDDVAARVRALAVQLAEGLRERKIELAANPAVAGIAVFRRGSEPPPRTREHLLERHRIRLGVTPCGLRAAPHFYNSEDEIEALLEAL